MINISTRREHRSLSRIEIRKRLPPAIPQSLYDVKACQITPQKWSFSKYEKFKISKKHTRVTCNSDNLINISNRGISAKLLCMIFLTQKLRLKRLRFQLLIHVPKEGSIWV